jgi:UDP-N-acetylmuramate--alanine ligase
MVSDATVRERGSAPANVLGRTRGVHFVGIGGIGMSGIAEVLATLGYRVSGSDARASDVTRRLASLGVVVHEGHAAGHVADADVVVVSSAIQGDNPEVLEARRRRIPVIPRAEMLAELMRLRYGIAVAGAHGKTTTTSMVALLLERAGLDPTAVIGGRLSAFGSNAKLGRGHCMVVEADESDGSFLKLSPAIAVITNVDREHLEHYGSYEHLLNAFVEFANRVPFYGAVVLCADDPRLDELRGRMTRRVVTYGLDRADRDLVGRDVTLEPFGASCDLVWRPQPEAESTRLGRLQLNVPGRHNLRNALAAVAVGLELDVPVLTILSSLAEFRGAERRFQVLGHASGVTVVDDYGHHPTELRAVLDAARTSHEGRLVVVFQPHRYTRTQLLFDDFVRELATADAVVVTEVYAAGEEPRAGVSGRALADAVSTASGIPVEFAATLDDALSRVVSLVRPGDMVLTLGAGSIGQLGARVLSRLEPTTGAASAVEADDRGR